MKKAVIFDMDGLLIDSERATFNEYKIYLKELGFDYTEKMYLQLLGKSKAWAYEVFYRDLGNDIDMDEIWKEVHIRLDEKLRNNTPFKKGCFELLSYLKEKNIKTCIATSSHRHRVDYILPDSFKAYFDNTICGDEVVNGKPNPDIFLKACKKIGVEPEEAIVLEDSENGILAAHNANIDVICIPDMLYPSPRIKDMCVDILDDLSQVIKKIEG